MMIYDIIEDFALSDCLVSGDYVTCMQCSECVDCSGCPIFEETKEYFEELSSE